MARLQKGDGLTVSPKTDGRRQRSISPGRKPLRYHRKDETASMAFRRERRARDLEILPLMRRGCVPALKLAHTNGWDEPQCGRNEVLGAAKNDWSIGACASGVVGAAPC